MNHPQRQAPAKSHKLTATIITHNEEKNLDRCINALLGVADEIVVVDSFSTDSTVEICRRYGCKVTSRKFTGFGSQRQYATGLAMNPYVLSIDPDEVLSEELREAIIALKESGFTHRVYSAKVITYLCGRPIAHSGMRPYRSPRLFDKRYATWDLRDVGENLTHPDSVIPEPLPGCIHHYRWPSDRDLDFKEMRRAGIRASGLAATSKKIGPLTPYIKAYGELLRAHIIDGALLDGHTGHRIALSRYKYTLAAYLQARHILTTSRKSAESRT